MNINNKCCFHMLLYGPFHTEWPPAQGCAKWPKHWRLLYQIALMMRVRVVACTPRYYSDTTGANKNEHKFDKQCNMTKNRHQQISQMLQAPTKTKHLTQISAETICAAAFKRCYGLSRWSNLYPCVCHSKIFMNPKTHVTHYVLHCMFITIIYHLLDIFITVICYFFITSLL